MSHSHHSFKHGNLQVEILCEFIHSGTGLQLREQTTVVTLNVVRGQNTTHSVAARLTMWNNNAMDNLAQ